MTCVSVLARNLEFVGKKEKDISQTRPSCVFIKTFAFSFICAINVFDTAMNLLFNIKISP